MRMLLTGRDGQLGRELQRALAPLGEIHTTSSREMNLACADTICRTIREYRPAVIVNAAAYTAVDRAESDKDLAIAVNATAVGVMAEEARKLGGALIHYSTDYVFDGRKEGAYTEEDAANPLNVYGESKLAGEQAIAGSGVANLTFRTCWVYGAGGHNFMRTILRLARERRELRIVNDQVGAPNWSRLLAEATALVLARAMLPGRSAPRLPRGQEGLFHLSSSGATSWLGFAEEILRRTGFNRVEPETRLVGISTTEYPTPARRPLNSQLSSARLEREFGIRIPDWREGLRMCVEDMYLAELH